MMNGSKTVSGPDDKSIVCGRGQKCYNSEGTKVFRNLVADNIKRYLTAKRRADKTVVVMEITSVLYKQKNMRFLKQEELKDGKGLVWKQLDFNEARKKVAHRFRDEARNYVDAEEVLSKRKEPPKEEEKVKDQKGVKSNKQRKVKRKEKPQQEKNADSSSNSSDDDSSYSPKKNTKSRKLSALNPLTSASSRRAKKQNITRDDPDKNSEPSTESAGYELTKVSRKERYKARQLLTSSATLAPVKTRKPKKKVKAPAKRDTSSETQQHQDKKLSTAPASSTTSTVRTDQEDAPVPEPNSSSSDISPMELFRRSKRTTNALWQAYFRSVRESEGLEVDTTPMLDATANSDTSNVAPSQMDQDFNNKNVASLPGASQHDMHAAGAAVEDQKEASPSIRLEFDNNIQEWMKDLEHENELHDTDGGSELCFDTDSHVEDVPPEEDTVESASFAPMPMPSMLSATSNMFFRREQGGASTAEMETNTTGSLEPQALPAVQQPSNSTMFNLNLNLGGAWPFSLPGARSAQSSLSRAAVLQHQQANTTSLWGQQQQPNNIARASGFVNERQLMDFNSAVMHQAQTLNAFSNQMLQRQQQHAQAVRPNMHVMEFDLGGGNKEANEQGSHLKF